MRKLRNFDSELKALADKAKALKDRRVRQLGELVMATGADALDADLMAGALLDAVAMTDAATKEGWRTNGAAFFRGRTRKSASRSARDLEALHRAKTARHRTEARKARTDTREWVVKRRERTRHLIELGGLVVKAGLVDLTGDDRATLYGALLTIAGTLQSDDRDHARALWKRHGERAFEGGAGNRDVES